MTNISPSLAAHLEKLKSVKRHLSRNKKIIKSLVDGNDKCSAAVDEAIERTCGKDFEGLPSSDVETSVHRMKHRRGRLPKIDADPELRKFVLERLDKMTFAELERQIEDAFPEDRRVRRSAIHSWWQNQL